MLRFVYLSKPLVKDLIQEIHQLATSKNIGTTTGNRVINIPEIKWNDALKVFEVSITLDVMMGPAPISRKENVNTVDNVNFNVTDEKEQAEIQRLEAENNAKKQEEVIVSS